jgi:hypothetical protein
MTNVVTINRPEVVAVIEEAAKKLTDGNKTEAVALAVRRLLDDTARARSSSAHIADRCVFAKVSISLCLRLTLNPMPKRVERSTGDRSPSARHPRIAHASQNGSTVATERKHPDGPRGGMRIEDVSGHQFSRSVSL